MDTLFSGSSLKKRANTHSHTAAVLVFPSRFHLHDYTTMAMGAAGSGLFLAVIKPLTTLVGESKLKLYFWLLGEIEGGHQFWMGHFSLSGSMSAWIVAIVSHYSTNLDQFEQARLRLVVDIILASESGPCHIYGMILIFLPIQLQCYSMKAMHFSGFGFLELLREHGPGLTSDTTHSIAIQTA